MVDQRISTVSTANVPPAAAAIKTIGAIILSSTDDNVRVRGMKGNRLKLSDAQRRIQIGPRDGAAETILSAPYSTVIPGKNYRAIDRTHQYVMSVSVETAGRAVAPAQVGPRDAAVYAAPHRPPIVKSIG